MTDQQWEVLKKIISGEKLNHLHVGFIIDSPWLPNWYGVKIVDYLSSDEIFLKSNLKAIKDFPDVMFLPGFWSEYGMCTEPSAFGARLLFPPNEFPHPYKIVESTDDIDSVIIPNPETDGLLPFVLNRLKLMQPKIEEEGHKIRFAVARGPLNIATYLMGVSGFLLAMMTEPDKIESLLKKITKFLKEWIQLQMKTFPTIDGIFLLDDIIGFIGEPEFKQFAFPYLKELYDENVSVKFLHNDASCQVSAPFLPDIGINLFNMGFDITLNELKTLTQNRVTLLGNIPPRDVLANGTVDDVIDVTKNLINSLDDKTKIILSCGGGMPPGVKSENIKAFINTVNDYRF